jgi:hypothetical protein
MRDRLINVGERRQECHVTEDAQARQTCISHCLKICCLRGALHTFQDNFFNYGATSEKWIAPEHRIKHTHATPVHCSSVFSATPEQTPAQVTCALDNTCMQECVPVGPHKQPA